MIELTAAQQAYYDLLVTLPGQGSPATIRTYVAGLNDAQALASLDVTARAFGTVASDPVANQLIRGQDGFQTTAYLAEKYGVEGPLLQGSTGQELVYIEKVSAPNESPVYEITEKVIDKPVTSNGTPVFVTPAPAVPIVEVTPTPVIPITPTPVTPITPMPVIPITPTPLTPITPTPLTPITPMRSNLALYGFGALALLLLLRR